MVNRSKIEYLNAIRQRYRRATKQEKAKILDEFCAVCGHHRKHAVRLLGQNHPSIRKRSGPKPTYGGDLLIALKRIWLASEQLCSKRLKAALPVWIPFYSQAHGPLDLKTSELLVNISPSTIDRLLRPVRVRYGRKGLSGTRPGTLLRNQIPVKTTHWDVTRPGFMEADTVAHCGDSIEGDFVWSLTFTDIYSGWTENRAIWNKGSSGVIEQVKDVEANLPFTLLGFHSDSGTEFLNHHLWRYFAHRPNPIDFTRTRPYGRNDNAYVEQKNWTHVRGLLGYQRIEKADLIPIINDLYRSWGAFHNFFCPNLKLIKKLKVGSKYIKNYDKPKTPYQRLLECPDITTEAKAQLTATANQLNPFKLKKEIEQKLKRVFNNLR